MSKIKTILSIIFIFTIRGCVSSAYPILWWSRECVLYLIIIIKPEVWIINHCLGLGHETMVCAVCLTMFLWWWWTQNIGWASTGRYLETSSSGLKLTGRGSRLTPLTTNKHFCEKPQKDQWKEITLIFKISWTPSWRSTSQKKQLHQDGMCHG